MVSMFFALVYTSANNERTNWGGKDKGKQRTGKGFIDIFSFPPVYIPKRVTMKSLQLLLIAG